MIVPISYTGLVGYSDTAYKLDIVTLQAVPKPKISDKTPLLTVTLLPHPEGVTVTD